MSIPRPCGRVARRAAPLVFCGLLLLSLTSYSSLFSTSPSHFLSNGASEASPISSSPFSPTPASPGSGEQAKNEVKQDGSERRREMVARSTVTYGKPTSKVERGEEGESAGVPLRNRTKIIFDDTRKIKPLWPSDSQCSQFQVRFASSSSIPRCALASYPGSGNTWTRYLIEAASGVFSGSIYRDLQLYMHGYYGELEAFNSGTTIVQKTHDCGPTHVKTFHGTAVLLLRNPYRAILSFHNYLFGGHTGYAPISNYRRKDWSAFVKLQAKAWLEMAVNWTTQADNLRVLHYEELNEDPVPSLKEVLEFRGIEGDVDRLKCLQRHTNKRFKRREEYIPAGLEIFSPEDTKKIDRAIRYVDYLLRSHNQRPIPLHMYEFYNGTKSTKMTVIPCNKGETKVKCDNRVDNMNKYGRKTSAKRSSKESRSEEDVGDQTGLGRFAKTQLGGSVTSLFTKLLKVFAKDPLDASIKDPANLRPLHLQEDPRAPVEARQILKDFDPLA